MRSAQSKFYWATSLAILAHKNKTLEAIKGSTVLEIGCSSGEDAEQYSLYAARYVGVDISDEAIKKCQSLGLRNAEFQCIDGHHLPFRSAEFQCVIVNSLLHHMDLERVLPEVKRLLSKNGLLIFREPLGTNPIFQVYRLLTPRARTVDERPFTYKDLKLFRSYFDLTHTQWFGFLSIFSAFIPVEWLRLLLTRIDALMSHSPLRYLYWQFAGIAKARD